jgi:hypothetical protein
MQDLTPEPSEADARTRTGDPFITSEVLYQLSYVGGSPMVAPVQRRLRPRSTASIPSRELYGSPDRGSSQVKQ